MKKITSPYNGNHKLFKSKIVINLHPIKSGLKSISADQL